MELGAEAKIKQSNFHLTLNHFKDLVSVPVLLSLHSLRLSICLHLCFSLHHKDSSVGVGIVTVSLGEEERRRLQWPPLLMPSPETHDYSQQICVGRKRKWGVFERWGGVRDRERMEETDMAA